MRIGVLILLLLAGCSSPQSRRSIASEPEEFGVVSLSSSTARIYPSGTSNDGKLKYHVYVELRDAYGKVVDCDPSEILLSTNNGQEIKYSYHRSSVGKYYLGLSLIPVPNLGGVKLMIGSFLLTKLKIPQMSAQLKPKVELIKKSSYRATFHFQLLNDFNFPVNISEAPDIIIHSEEGLIEEVVQVNNSTWKFELIYPEVNQLTYISVRYRGALFSNVFRFQHIEREKDSIRIKWNIK